MTEKVKMSAPRMAVLMDDGAIHDIQAVNVDMVMFERDAVKHKWPSGQEAPFHWMTYLAWHALRREGTILKDVTFDDFMNHRCVAIDPTPAEVDPSLPVPETG